MEKKELTTKEELDNLYNCSALTWGGLSVSDENLKAVEDWLKEYEVDTSNAVFNIISGRLMNKTYSLKGDNAYLNDLHIVSITGIDVKPIIFARFEVGARWFDDIVDNNRKRN